MSFPTNDQIISIATKRVIPDNYTTLTGTITASAGSRFVTGTGTLFLTEIGGDRGVGNPSKPAEGWLVDLTGNELRRIQDVIDNTHLVLESGFTGALAGAACNYVIGSRTKFMGVACSAGGGTLNTIALPAAFSANYGNEADSNYTVDPMIADGTGGTIIVTLQYAGR